MNQKPLVTVVWKDAHGSASATYSEHEIPHEPLVVNTVGWLMRDDEIGISICNESCGDGDYRGHTFVPRPMIVSVTRINKPRIRQKKVSPCRPSEPVAS